MHASNFNFKRQFNPGDLYSAANDPRSRPQMILAERNETNMFFLVSLISGAEDSKEDIRRTLYH